MKLVNYKRGDVIYSSFSTDRQVFIIEEGYVFAFTYEDSGKRRIHLIYGPGHYFPVISTFKGTAQRASYETLTDSSVKILGHSEFTKKLSEGKFCRDILDKTVDQLSIFAERVIDLQTTNLEDRLMLRLNSLCKESGASNSMVLPYTLKQYHLADMLGVERESITRALTRLKRKKLIEQTEDGRIHILKG